VPSPDKYFAVAYGVPAIGKLRYLHAFYLPVQYKYLLT